MLVAPPHSPPESITVALSSALVGAEQQQRRTTAEGFAQSHATLLGVDCRGRLYAGLARFWSSGVVAHGRRWTITLRDDARFWNGDRVTASDVLAAWRSTAETTDVELARRLVAATKVIDDRTLAVTLSDSTPLILAHASLAIRTAPSSAASRVRVRLIDATAARDALDGGADLVVADDPAIVSYATHRAELLTLPLPWDRTYVVLTSKGARLDISATLRLTLAESLADAVRADSRIAERPFWWESSNHCSAPVGRGTRPVAPARSSPRVVYQSGDRVAQGIAERLVALTGSRSARDENEVGTLLPRLSQATALAPSAFGAALRAGDDAAYVLPLPRFTVAPCYDFAMLLRAAPWLESARTGRGLPVFPLIETRSHAIVRRGRVGLSVDADGSLRLLDGPSGKNGKP